MSSKNRSGIGIKLTKNCSKIPYYLMFIDDCLTFCKATRKVTRNIRYILDHSWVSGQLVHYQNVKFNFVRELSKQLEGRSQTYYK